jgi:hypothetical protein
MFKRNNNETKKKIIKDGVPPKLVVKIKQVSPKKWLITLIHPNTLVELYSKNHVAHSVNEAFELGNRIKKEKFSDVVTVCEEILHIPRPKRGKMALKTKEEFEGQKNNFEDND